MLNRRVDCGELETKIRESRLKEHPKDNGENNTRVESKWVAEGWIRVRKRSRVKGLALIRSQPFVAPWTKLGW